ncbi:hypothetical protein EPO04_03205 [Patescibacteria group bacterium]|nr:MAG: hypothetical protein EPO04_03205 [Patescibacteria group bacterium]
MKSLTSNPIAHTALRASVVASTFLPATAMGAAGPDCPATIDPANSTINQGVDCSKGTSSADSLFGANGVFSQISNILIFLVGAVSVIMLIYGGFRYVISSGNSDQVTAAKNTIIYSIVGIVVAILAYAVVGFVTGSLTASPTS